jgi:hypothetical protein
MPVPGLDLNAGSAWSTPKNQLQYTRRSGVGVDAAGHLLVVGGGNLTRKSLAAALTIARRRPGDAARHPQPPRA